MCHGFGRSDLRLGQHIVWHRNHIRDFVIVTDAVCAMSPVNAAQLAEAFGAGTLTLDVSKKRNLLYLPTYAASLPETGHALSDYRFECRRGAMPPGRPRPSYTLRPAVPGLAVTA